MLREPGWLFAILGLAIVFSVGAGLCVGAASAFAGGFNTDIITGLVWPTSIGAGLAAGSIGGRLRRARIITRREAISRAAAAGSAAGFAWPFSFAVFPLLDGDFAAFAATLPVVGACTLAGAASAAGGALAASFASLRPL